MGNMILSLRNQLGSYDASFNEKLLHSMSDVHGELNWGVCILLRV
jgi:hypothetical protein